MNGNAQFDAGDYVGCYGTYPDCTAATPPQSGLNIQMTVEGGAQPPDTGSGTGAISGTLVFPGGREDLSKRPGEDQATTEAARAPAEFVVQDIPNMQVGRFVPGEVIVKFKTDVRAQSLSVQGLSLQRARAVGVAKAALYRAEGLDERGTLELIGELNARPDVAYAEPNTIKTIQKTPNDEFYPFQWHYEAMNLPAAWDIEDGTSSSVMVAVVDSGAIPHPDLQGSLLPGYDFVSDPANGGDGDGYDPDPTDISIYSGWHGSHVAGTIAASTNNGVGVAGVSWGAQIVPIRALGDLGGSVADIINAVLWAAGESVEGVPVNPNPAQVINLSLGGEAPCAQIEQEAFDRVRALGITVVVAAGNEDTDVGFSSPANCDGVIAVGATGPQNTRAPYSNYGTGIDVMAPGGDIDQTLTIEGQTVIAGVLSTLIDDATGEYAYGFYNGTSMAAPHIAGLVALMLSQEPGLDPDTVLSRLQASAAPLSAEACNRPSGEECGAGLVNAAAALASTGTPPDPTDPTDPTDPLPPPPDTGSVTTFVAALYCLAQCSDFDIDLSNGGEVSAETLQAPYSITDLTAGTYIAAAWQDLDGDGAVSSGEPFGQHLNALTLAAGQELDRADIYLQPFTPQASGAAESQTAKSALARALEQRAARTGASAASEFASQALKRARGME